MKRFLKMSAALLAVAMVGTVGTVAQADVFVGADPDGVDVNGNPSPGGDGMKWEDPANWALDTVPGNNGGVLDANGDPVQAVDGDGNPVVDDNGNPVQARLNHSWSGQDVVFDTATWDFLAAGEAAGIDYLQSATQHRVARLLLGEVFDGGPAGDQSLTFDFADPAGGVRQVLQTNSSSAVFGSRRGNCVVNMISGEVNTGSNTTFGARDAMGTLNLSGGTFNVGRANLVLGNGGGAGVGFVNITGGTLVTRGGCFLNNASVFEVVGSSATVGIGSQGSVDGFWDQAAASTLRVGLDAGGLSPILIDDVEDPGAGDGNATFAAGSILDVFDAGGATNAVATVMTWEGTLTGAPTLSAASVSAGWTMQIVGNELQVSNSTLPDPPMGVVGDFNGDMVVDCADLDGYVGNIGAAATGALEALDIDGDGLLSADDADTHIRTLVVTMPNGVTGTFPGDVNCDGSVSVLGDAFALVAGLNNPATSYAQGDLNFDGVVTVLGDAFILVANLNNSNQ